MLSKAAFSALFISCAGHVAIAAIAVYGFKSYWKSDIGNAQQEIAYEVTYEVSAPVSPVNVPAQDKIEPQEKKKTNHLKPSDLQVTLPKRISSTENGAATSQSKKPEGNQNGNSGIEGIGFIQAEYPGVLMPEYPTRSRELGEEGVVRYRISVDMDGKVSLVDLLESSGFQRLDEAARLALIKSTFIPARNFGTPIKSERSISFIFNLKS